MEFYKYFLFVISLNPNIFLGTLLLNRRIQFFSTEYTSLLFIGISVIDEYGDSGSSCVIALRCVPEGETFQRTSDIL